jgi:hypothetical protein
VRKKYASLIRRAKENKLDVSLSYNDYQFLKLSDCEYCGVSELLIKFYCEILKVNTPWITIDRKDNNRGYLKENCVASCFLCNKIKGSFFSFEEMLEIGSRYVKPKFQKFEKEAYESFSEWCELNVLTEEEEEELSLNGF